MTNVKRCPLCHFQLVPREYGDYLTHQWKNFSMKNQSEVRKMIAARTLRFHDCQNHDKQSLHFLFFQDKIYQYVSFLWVLLKEDKVKVIYT